MKTGETVLETKERSFYDKKIRVNDLKPAPYNKLRREGYDKTQLAELTASVKEVGVLQPLLVRAFTGGGKYEIVFGERRFLAAQAAGLEEVNCHVMDLDDETAYKLNLVENAQRADSSLAVQAEQLELLMAPPPKGKGLTVLAIAAACGKAPSDIAKLAQLTKLIPTWRKLLGQFHRPDLFQLIARLPADAQKELADREADDPGFFDPDNTEKKVRERLEKDFLRELDPAPFDLKDPTLNPKMGACEGCKQRSSAQSLLFPELKKGDRCLNGDCFSIKLQKTAQLKAEEFRKANPNGSIICSEYEKAGLMQAPHVHLDSLKKVKAGEKNAIPTLDLATGKVFHVQAPKKSEDKAVSKALTKGQKTDAPKKQAPLSERLALHEAKRTKYVCAEVIALLQKPKWPENRNLNDALKLVVCLGLSIGSADYDQAWEEIDNPDFDLLKAWKHEFECVDGLSIAQQIRKSINPDYYTLDQIIQQKVALRLERCALFFGIDLNPLKTKAEKEVPLPKALMLAVSTKNAKDDADKKKASKK